MMKYSMNPYVVWMVTMLIQVMIVPLFPSSFVNPKKDVSLGMLPIMDTIFQQMV